MHLQIGDKISVPAAWGTRHYGVYVGRMGGRFHGVVHNDKYAGRVLLVELNDFLAGRNFKVESRVGGGWLAQVAVAQRAVALCGREYSLLNFNCEHAATLAQTGTPWSQQLRVAALLCAVVVGAYLLKDAGAA